MKLRAWALDRTHVAWGRHVFGMLFRFFLFLRGHLRRLTQGLALGPFRGGWVVELRSEISVTTATRICFWGGMIVLHGAP